MRRHLTYANVTATLALFLALTGGVVYAASKIRTNDIKRHAVTAKKLAPNSVKNGKLVDGAVNAPKLADGSVGNAKVADDSIEPSKLTFPVYYVASPTGGEAGVPGGGQTSYPLTGAQWTQTAESINVVFGEATTTLAYDGSGSGQCQVFFDVRIDGQQLGGGSAQTSSTSPQTATQTIGAAPQIGPTSDESRTLEVFLSSNGDCTGGSSVDSARFKVLDFG